MSVLNDTPIPVDDPIAQPKRPQFKDRPDPFEGHITRPWVDYFTSQGTATTQSPSRIASAAASSQTGSIGAVDISDGLLAAGLYRFTYYASITRAAGVSSSLAVTLDWTDGGNAKAFTGAAITANAVTASQSGSQLIRIDAASPVRYSTTYASVGAPTMAYALDVILERIPT